MPSTRTLFLIFFTLISAGSIQAQKASSSTALADTPKPFTSRLTVETGGGIAFSYNESPGTSDLDLAILSVSGYFGLMITNGFELGIYPYYSNYDIGGTNSMSEFAIFLSPAYNFNLKSNLYPYIEAMGGIGSADTRGGTQGLTAVGGNFGLKYVLRGSAMLLIHADYLHESLENQSVYSAFGVESQNTTLNTLSFGVGFRVFFTSGGGK